MASLALQDLPTELLVQIYRSLDDLGDVASLGQTNTFLRKVFYHHHIDITTSVGQASLQPVIVEGGEPAPPVWSCATGLLECQQAIVAELGSGDDIKDTATDAMLRLRCLDINLDRASVGAKTLQHQLCFPYRGLTEARWMQAYFFCMIAAFKLYKAHIWGTEKSATLQRWLFLLREEIKSIVLKRKSFQTQFVSAGSLPGWNLEHNCALACQAQVRRNLAVGVGSLGPPRAMFRAVSHEFEKVKARIARS